MCDTRELESTVVEGRKIAGAVKVLSNGRKISLEAESGICIGVLALILVHGSKALLRHGQESSKVKAVKISILSKTCRGVKT